MIEAIKGDITTIKVEAIVNAANRALLGGGGVDGAIHHAAGPDLLRECKMLNGCEVCEAKITNGYNLAADWVIHTVGPVWHGGIDNEEAKLALCYKNCLALANEYKLKSIAFPAISTGVYRFPYYRAAQIAVREVKKFMEEYDIPAKVVFVCFNDRTTEAYQELLVSPPISGSTD